MERKLQGRKVGIIATAALFVAVVTGCAPAVPTATHKVHAPAPHTSSSPSSTPSATPTPTPTVDPNVLFTITATATASGSNGAVVNLVQTVYKPVATTANMAADLALFKAQCADFGTTVPNPLYVTTEISSTAAAGSPAWPNTKSPLGVDMSGLQPTAWSGASHPFESDCAAPIIVVPGAVHGVEEIASTNSADGATGWANALYGFAFAVDEDDSQIPLGQRITISNCAITLGATAAADPIASLWPAQKQVDPKYECQFGKV